MPTGLSVSDVVNVQIILQPGAAPTRDFGALLIVGNTDIIDVSERIREYSNEAGVAADFGTTAPEYTAALAFFSQTPKPVRVKVGRWAQTATAGVLKGAPLSAAQQAANLASLQAVTSGTLTFTIDSTPRAITGLNFSSAVNLNGVASIINASSAFSPYGIVTFNGTKFIVRSNTAGTTSTIGYGSSPTGTDVSALLGVSAASGASAPVGGALSETALQATLALMNAQADWYAITFASNPALTSNDALLVAAACQGASPTRRAAFTTQDPLTLDPTSITDLAYKLSAAAYDAVIQYSSSSPYAICSFLGRALGVNFNGSKTALTMKFKTEPGTVAELLSESQADALDAKHCNVFVRYENGSAMIQQGVCSSGRFWDEVHGLDWLANRAQTDIWNALYQSPTKIPQTDDGMHLLATVLESSLAQSVENGLVAPGIWNSEGFGQLLRGDALTKGYYIYVPKISTQAQADRELRKGVLMQVAIKMAGAIHFQDVTISVNR